MSVGGGWVLDVWNWAVALLGLSWMLASALLLSRPKTGYRPSFLLPWCRLLLFLACGLPGLLIWRGDAIVKDCMKFLGFRGFHPPMASGWMEAMLTQNTEEISAQAEIASAWLPTALWCGVLLVIAVPAMRRWLGLVSGWLGLRAIRKLGRRWSTPLLDEICAEVGLPRAPEVRLLQEVASPMTFGWRRPTVLLPADFPRLDPDCQRAIISHEFLHIRRRDWLWAFIERAIAAPWGLHPWVAQLLDRLSVLREQVVDQAAVRLTGSRKVYLQALVLYTGPSKTGPSKIGSSCSTSSNLSASTALAFQQSHLRQRVAQLTEEQNMSKLYPWTMSAGFAIAFISAALLMVLASPQAVLAGAAESAYSVEDQGVTKPIRLVGPAPAYPEVSREEKVQGMVVVKTIVGPTGRIEKADVLKSIGPVFSQAVLDVLPQWRFEPATLDGEPITVQYNLTFNFRLDDKQGSEEG